MAKIRILVSLTTNDNDYQIEQAQSAEQAASKLGVSAEIIYANNAIRCTADCLPRPFLFLLTPDKPSKCLCKRFSRKSVPRSACSPCLPRFLLLLRSNLGESHSSSLQKASYNAARLQWGERSRRHSWGERMKSRRKSSSIDRRKFLTATGTGLLAASMPSIANGANFSERGAVPNSPAQTSGGALRKIPIGVFDRVYEKSSLAEKQHRVSALGLEPMDLGTGGYPRPGHGPIGQLLADAGKR